MEEEDYGDDVNKKLKVAIAMALFKSKLLQNKKRLSASVSGDAPPNPSQSEDETLKWKRKAKERKLEILRLQEDLKIAEDGARYDVFPQSATCKCYFFNEMSELSKNNLTDHDLEGKFKDVLSRRFIRRVRISERRRRRAINGISGQNFLSGTKIENKIDELSASVDFLVNFCETVSPMEDKMHKSWSHQAVDFILNTLKHLLEMGSYVEPVEGIISSLIIRLLRRMCNTTDDDEEFKTGKRYYINEDIDDYEQDALKMHLLRKLGSEAYVGQRVILSVSHNISNVAESLLFMDPFNDAFPNLHNCMYALIQIIEFFISDYFLNWASREDFHLGLLEEWMTSVLEARKALEVLENRNGLYVVYIDRVIADIAKKAGQSTCFERLNPNLRSALFN